MAEMKKRRTNLMQKTIAVLLAAVLVVSMASNEAPMTVLADETDGQQEHVAETTAETVEDGTETEEGRETEPVKETNTEESGQETPESGGETEQETLEPDVGTGQETLGTGTEETTEPETVSGNDAESDVEPGTMAEPKSVMRAAQSSPQADNIASGDDWTLDADGKLTIRSDDGMTDWINNKYTEYNGTTYTLLVKNAAIQDGVKSIKECAFQRCGNLTDITIPKSVQQIGQYAFWSCSSLKRITIPDGVTRLAYQSFLGCTNLEKVKLPDTLQSIANSTFMDCKSLRSITLPSSMTSIETWAFKGCTALEKVVMLGDNPPTLASPQSIASAFGACKFVTDNQKGIYVPAGKAQT